MSMKMLQIVPRSCDIFYCSKKITCYFIASPPRDFVQGPPLRVERECDASVGRRELDRQGSEVGGGREGGSGNLCVCPRVGSGGRSNFLFPAKSSHRACACSPASFLWRR